MREETLHVVTVDRTKPFTRQTPLAVMLTAGAP